MKYKIAIVVPLLAPEVAKNWAYVQLCLNRTLRSILKNDSVDLRVFVVCQSEPESLISDNRVVFVKSCSPIPKDVIAQGNDKGFKLAQGIRAASEFQPNYVMFADADDLISCELFKYVVANPGYDAYCIECGYDWRDGSKHLTKRHQFHRFCGTSFILRFGIDLFPAWLGNQDDADWICEKSHTCRDEVLADQQFKTYYIDEPKVIYVSGGQDQLMDRKKRLRRRLKDAVYSLWRGKKLSQDLRDEFSI
jgi:hypothetical protein